MTNDEQPIDVSAIRTGLRDLRTRMPQAPEHVHAFGEVLAAYMNDEIYASAMTMPVMLLMSDLARGKSGYSIALPSCLLGLARLPRVALELYIPSMLRAAAGSEHAQAAEALVAALESE